MTLLPTSLQEDAYSTGVRPRPLLYWLPALAAVRERHGLPRHPWQRFRRGRNVAFALGEEFVVKLIPPFWRRGAVREAAALSWVNGRLPVPTPTLVAQGVIDGWTYLVETRVPGQVLADLWPALRTDERVHLARRHGEIMAALHALPPHDAPRVLAFDWPGMLAEQWRECAPEMRRAGVPAPLLADLPAYLEGARVLLAATDATVLLHGDLNALNLLVDRRNGEVEIVGLIDLSDAKLGPVAHEFISPGVHQYCGERAALRAWYAGYRLGERATVAFERDVMARAMLYYAGLFDKFLAFVPTTARATWPEVARHFWQVN